MVPTFLQRVSRWALQAVEDPRGPCPEGWKVHLWRREDVGSRAGRGREAEEAAAVARATALASVTVDGGLELTGGAEAFPLALIRVQVFHVPWGENTHRHRASDHHSKVHIVSISTTRLTGFIRLRNITTHNQYQRTQNQNVLMMICYDLWQIFTLKRWHIKKNSFSACAYTLRYQEYLQNHKLN